MKRAKQSKINCFQALFSAYWWNELPFFSAVGVSVPEVSIQLRPSLRCWPVLLVSPRQPQKRWVCCVHIATSFILFENSECIKSWGSQRVAGGAQVCQIPAKASELWWLNKHTHSGIDWDSRLNGSCSVHLRYEWITASLPGIHHTASIPPHVAKQLDPEVIYTILITKAERASTVNLDVYSFLNLLVCNIKFSGCLKDKHSCFLPPWIFLCLHFPWLPFYLAYFCYRFLPQISTLMGSMFIGC